MVDPRRDARAIVTHAEFDRLGVVARGAREIDSPSGGGKSGTVAKAKKAGDASTPPGSTGGPPGKRQRRKVRKNGRRRGSRE
jgi:hypothetical protein